MAKAFRNAMRAKNRQEAGTLCNSVHVNNLVHWMPCAAILFNMDTPHSSVSIWLFCIVWNKPVYESTRKVFMTIVKRKERRMQAITMPSIPGWLSSNTTNTVSCRGLPLKDGLEQMHS
jgi:hypothetical protein